MVHRYRRTALIAPVIGFLLGAVVFGVLSTGGPLWTWSGATVASVARAAFGFGVVGLAVSLAALIGGIVVVACIDRQLTGSSSSRTLCAAFGAAGGVLVLGIVFATVQGLTGENWAYLIVCFTVVLAILAGIIAAILVHRAERLSERTRPTRAEHPLPSAWSEF